MNFSPETDTKITILNKEYEFATLKGIVYAEIGKAAIIYKIRNNGLPYALKVFFPNFRFESIKSNASKIAEFRGLNGLSVAVRTILTDEFCGELIGKYPDLHNAVLMPWIQGKAWINYLYNKTPISKQQSLRLAMNLCAVLSGLEENDLAHCDLSNKNFVISKDYGFIELVDIEDMYGPTFVQPSMLPIGSPGYSHWASSDGLWCSETDRFAGAILLAEILGWSDINIRDHAWGECFFEPGEVQKSCKRFEELKGSLISNWGNDIGNLFEQAWLSKSLVDCPNFGIWSNNLAGVELAPDQDSDLYEDNESLHYQSRKEAQQLNTGKTVLIVESNPKKAGEKKHKSRQIPYVFISVMAIVFFIAIVISLIGFAGFNIFRDAGVSLGSVATSPYPIAQPTIPIYSKPAGNPTITVSASSDDECLSWKQVSLSHVGKTLCVYGPVKRWYQSEYFEFVARFSEDTNSFLVVNRYGQYDISPGDCILVEGEVINLGSKPAIDLMSGAIYFSSYCR